MVDRGVPTAWLQRLLSSRAALLLTGALWIACFLYLASVRIVPDIPGLRHNDVNPLGHVIASLVFAVLAFLAIGGWEETRRRRLRAAALVIASTLALGIVIEVIQLRVPGRDAELSDVAFDLLGAILGVGLVLALRAARTPRTTVVLAAQAVVIVLAGLGLASTALWTPAVPLTESCDEPPSLPEAPDRSAGPLVWYELDQDAGPFLRDRSGRGAPLDLRLSRPPGTELLARRGVRFRGGEATSPEPAAKVSNAIEKTRSFTVEARLALARLDQNGPARIATISAGPASNEVNLHVGVDDDALSVRIRTVCDYFNWIEIPGIFTEAERPLSLAVTYTRGQGAVYADGELVAEFAIRDGELSTWNDDYHLTIGNEADGSRPFEGLIGEVAIYDYARSRVDIAADAQAGIT